MRVFIAPFGDIVKIKIFNTEPRVIYSTDPNATGKLDPYNASLLTALAGTPTSKHEHEDEVWDLDDEERINVEIVETYVPIRDTGGQIIGSFEIYEDITRNLAMADKIFVRSWGTLAVTVLGVFAALMLVLRKATKAINLATAELMTTNERLQQEVVEHKQTGQSLRETQERFRDFFKNAPVGFHIFGPDRKILDINDAELEMIGYTKDEIVGKKTWADLILPEQRTDFEGHWCDIIAKGQVQSLKYTLVHKDGRHIDVLLNASARFDEEGHLINTRGSVLNITERRRLEREFLNVVERERRKIGLELHDSIGQRLTGVKFMTDVLEQRLSDKSREEASYAAEITTVVTEAMEQTRGLAKALHPFDLGENDLVLALEELVATTESLFDVSCTFVCDKSIANNDILVATNLYCIAREAITNAVRHGKAKNVCIELAGKGGKSTLTVKSDGLDFPEVRAEEKGMGLKIMSYRAEIIDGAIDIRRGFNGGAVVTCVFSSKERRQ